MFFPLGTLAGLSGVALWPLHFGGVIESYPGQNHAHLMANGLFGSFIFGFLGTAMPRMLSVPRFTFWQTLTLLLIQAGSIACYAASRLAIGDSLFLLLMLTFIGCVAVRVPWRQDTPPPGFVLVGMALGCVAAGTILSLVGSFRDIEPQTVALQRLLSYQGFVLLPILGIGPFLLPRFLGMPSPHDFPESLHASKGWWRKAFLALAAGAVIIGSFFIESAGSFRAAYALRFSVTAGYFLLEMPLHRAPKASNTIGAAVRIALLGIVLGFLAVALWPEYRVALLHLTLVGGFAVITFTVATRVVLGHSGNEALFETRLPALQVATLLLLAAFLLSTSWVRADAPPVLFGKGVVGQRLFDRRFRKLGGFGQP